MADQTRKKARGKQPISRHPLFPAIVGLWTGVLLGLCALALSPPFGASARILLALGAFAIGCVLGLMMGRRFADPALSARAADERVAIRKRGELWSELESLAAAAATDSAKAPQPAADGEAPASVEEAVTDKPAPLMTQAWEGHSDPAEPVVPVAGKPVKSVPATMPPSGSAAERIAGAELSELSHVELLERLALSMQRRGRPSAVMSILQEEVAEPRPSGREEHASDESHRTPGGPDRPVASITGRRSSADTEDALREALAALQRMSGAA